MAGAAKTSAEDATTTATAMRADVNEHDIVVSLEDEDSCCKGDGGGHRDLPLGPILVAIAVMTFWGATPVLTRIAVRDFDPLTVAVLRTSMAGLLGGAVLAATRQKLPTSPSGRRLLLVSALSGFVLFPLLFTFGQQRTSAMHGGMILASLPIFTGAYAALLARRRPVRGWVIGSAVALAGEIALVAFRAGSGGAHTSLSGDLLIAVSVLIVALGYVAGARLGQTGYDSLATTFWGVAIGLVVIAPVLVGDLAADGIPHADPGPWAAVIFLATVTSIVGYVGWYWALAHGGIARIATIQFLQPFSGLVLAAVLLGEDFTAPLIAASVAILVGVTIAQRAR
jgi:drug/metabolite transporter (DMT)-like permease